MIFVDKSHRRHAVKYPWQKANVTSVTLKGFPMHYSLATIPKDHFQAASLLKIESVVFLGLNSLKLSYDRLEYTVANQALSHASPRATRPHPRQKATTTASISRHDALCNGYPLKDQTECF